LDDPEHTLFFCNRWWRPRWELMVEIDKKFSPETIINTMLESKEKREAVCGFIHQVLKTKEEEKRQRQRNPLNQ
jgi:hypothetical protein